MSEQHNQVRVAAAFLATARNVAHVLTTSTRASSSTTRPSTAQHTHEMVTPPSYNGGRRPSLQVHMRRRAQIDLLSSTPRPHDRTISLPSTVRDHDAYTAKAALPTRRRARLAGAASLSEHALPVHDTDAATAVTPTTTSSVSAFLQVEATHSVGRIL